MSNVSRRSVIVGAATGLAIGVTPAVIANPVEFEGSAKRVNRLARELSEALADWCEGEFRAIVQPGKSRACAVIFQNCDMPLVGVNLPSDFAEMVHDWQRADGEYQLIKASGAADRHPNSPEGVALHDAGVERFRAGFDLLEALSGSAVL